MPLAFPRAAKRRITISKADVSGNRDSEAKAAVRGYTHALVTISSWLDSCCIAAMNGVNSAPRQGWGMLKVQPVIALSR
jgi:hypothetical protein